jgi:DNA topoisomerase-1
LDADRPAPTLAATPAPRELARRARLRYTTDDNPGIVRIRAGRGFTYRDGRDRPIRQRARLERIGHLAIPPAWTDVWISPQANGHLQATGRDARGRKQYIYHSQWQVHASRTKFSKLRRFGEALPRLRRRVARHLALPKLSRTKVVATVIALLDRTLARVGNEEYARNNDSYGLTTLRDRHASINGARLQLRFPGKSGKLHEVGLHDRRVARIVRQCQDLPGQQLFQYRDEQGLFRRVESSDVNEYLQAVTGHPFTAKDFRTWRATALLLERLSRHTAASLTATECRRVISRALSDVADALGNTVTICRKYYVHPQLIEWFEQGKLAAICKRAGRSSTQRLQPCEQMLLRLLRHLERGSRLGR